VLDEAVVDCYGWPRSAAQDPKELVRRLTELNREITEEGGPTTRSAEVTVGSRC